MNCLYMSYIDVIHFEKNTQLHNEKVVIINKASKQCWGMKYWYSWSSSELGLDVDYWCGFTEDTFSPKCVKAKNGDLKIAQNNWKSYKLGLTIFQPDQID